jgi:flavin-dependent dehydrogenase
VLRHVASASPHLAKRLTGAEAVLDRPLAISSIPYGYVVGATDEPWRVGDQAAVIPSFSGDGMSIALHSASLAAKHFLSGKSACDYHKALRRQTRIQIARATLLSKLLVSPAGQLLAMAAIHSAPAIMIAAAKLTRIPDIETELAT